MDRSAYLWQGVAMATAVMSTEWLPDVSIGDRLRIVRRRKRRTQDEMAEALGVKKTTYSAWESGRNTPSHKEVQEIARRLYALDRVPQWWTLGANDEPRSRDHGSEGWGFESLRVHPSSHPARRRSDRRRHLSVVPLRLDRDIAA
jgi:transcriptional regulator with XRE-family HTH domain